MKRHYFMNGDLKLSYLDSGGGGEVVIALHAHWMQALNYNLLADELLLNWRVIALDQRGHGHSDHTKSYTREDYLGDITILLKHLNITKPVILIGNSLGAVNTYQFTAQNPNFVKAMIIEDIGVDISGNVDFSLNWEGCFQTKEELEARIGLRFAPYLRNSFCKTEQGWKLMFDPKEIIESHSHLYGNYWDDWLQSECPCLLIRGNKSVVTTQEHLEEMSLRRPNTILKTIDGGHVIHIDNPKEFNDLVKEFLSNL